jgi:hypothetical protein
MGAVHRVVLEPGGAVLTPYDQRILRVVDRVAAQAPEHGAVELRARGADGQHDRRFLLAGGQGHDLVHLLVDAPGLVHDGEGVIQAL